MCKIMVVAAQEKFMLQQPNWTRKAGRIEDLPPVPVNNTKSRVCEIFAVVVLNDQEYSDFTKDFWKDREYFTEYNKLLKESGYLSRADRFDSCLLVTNDGGLSGVLVDTQGYDYARYTAKFNCYIA